MESTEETYVLSRLFCHNPTEYVGQYKDMVAYAVNDSSLEGTCSGYPKYVLIDKLLMCRYSTPEESLELIDLKNKFGRTKKKY